MMLSAQASLVMLAAITGALVVPATLSAAPQVIGRRQAKPTIGLRLSLLRRGRAMRAYGVASTRLTRPMRALDKRARVAVERRATRLLGRAEALVRRAYARGTTHGQRPRLLDRAQRDFAAWEAQVGRLVAARAFDSPVYKQWARKVWEAQLLQSHAALRLARSDRNDATLAGALDGKLASRALDGMLSSLHRQSPARFKAAIERAWGGLYAAARPSLEADLLAHNPLALLPRRLQSTRSPRQAARTIDYRPGRNAWSPRTWIGKRPRYRVRDDVAYVWCPGVVRTNDEFRRQQRVLLQNGTLSLRAETASFRDEFTNAYAVAAAVNKARRITRNPNVKVVLVGYSQGNTNAYAFLDAVGRNPRERALFAELRKNIVHVHHLNSAARGTPLANIGVALVKLLTGRGHDIRHLDARVTQIEAFFKGVGHAARWRLIRWLRRDPRRARAVLARLTGRRGTVRLARLRRWLADKTHDALVGRLESLTTYNGQKLLGSKTLSTTLSDIPVLNTIGAVPEARRGELLPSKGLVNQTAGWRVMHEHLGLANDYQVPVKYQKLGDQVRTAVDLPTLAVGHWGAAGVPIKLGSKVFHGERHYAHFSTELHAFGVAEMVRRMGL